MLNACSFAFRPLPSGILILYLVTMEQGSKFQDLGLNKPSDPSTLAGTRSEGVGPAHVARRVASFSSLPRAIVSACAIEWHDVVINYRSVPHDHLPDASPPTVQVI